MDVDPYRVVIPRSSTRSAIGGSQLRSGLVRPRLPWIGAKLLWFVPTGQKTLIPDADGVTNPPALYPNALRFLRRLAPGVTLAV
jgi:hypothetical protein